jgi:hypothetical protein
MQVQKEKKMCPNDKCNCGSNIKFKKCCGGPNRYEIGQKNSSKDILFCIEAFKCAYEEEGYNIIDITSDLRENTYRNYQVHNYVKKTIMLAERNESNKAVFKTRINSDDSNIILMYRGGYRTFAFDDLEEVMDSLYTMIEQANNRSQNDAII